MDGTTADERRVVLLPSHVAIFAIAAAATGRGQQGGQTQHQDPHSMPPEYRCIGKRPAAVEGRLVH